MNKLFLVFLAACRLPHVEPAVRDDSTQRAALVAVTSSCTEPDPFDAEDARANNRSPESVDQIEWAPTHAATGFIISERHVITAAHAVFCPIIPNVSISTLKGQRFAVVERDDTIFPHGDEPTDLARLELSAANGFGFNIAPPVIRNAIGGETCCAETWHGRTCGTIDPYHVDTFLATGMRKGDSGAPVYCSGAVVGVVTHTGKDGAKYLPMTSYWLEGT